MLKFSRSLNESWLYWILIKRALDCFETPLFKKTAFKCILCWVSALKLHGVFRQWIDSNVLQTNHMIGYISYVTYDMVQMILFPTSILILSIISVWLNDLIDIDGAKMDHSNIEYVAKWAAYHLFYFFSYIQM